MLVYNSYVMPNLDNFSPFEVAIGSKSFTSSQLCLVYNSYATPNLDNFSPFEVAIGSKALLAPRFEYKT